MNSALRHALAALGLTSLTSFAPSATAAVVANYSDDMAGYLAATGAASIGTLPVGGSNGTVVGSVTFTNGPGANLVFNPLYTNEFARPLAISNDENFNMDIAGGAFAIGFQIQEPTYNRPASNGFTSNFGCNFTCVNAVFSIELFSGLTSLGTFLYDAPDDPDLNPNGDAALGFFGVHSDTAFDRVTVRDTSNQPDNEYFGNFTLGQRALQTQGVPEPGSLALMLAALGAAAAVGARRCRG